jgi:hypothetical protein
MIETLPSTRVERWRLLTSLIALWRPELTPADGFSSGCVDEAEDRLKIPIPIALREWYLLAGKRKDIWSGQDEFLSPNQLEVGEFLIIYVENQAVVQWGIRRGDLGQDDPPVFVSDDEVENSWHLENESVTEFALQAFVSNLKWSRHNRCYANGAGNSKVLQVIEENYRRLPLPDWRWPMFPTRLFGDEDIVIEQNGEGDRVWLSACTRTEEAFRKMERLVLPVGIQWESSSDEWPAGWCTSADDL